MESMFIFLILIILQNNIHVLFIKIYQGRQTIEFCFMVVTKWFKQHTCSCFSNILLLTCNTPNKRTGSKLSNRRYEELRFLAIIHWKVTSCYRREWKKWTRSMNKITRLKLFYVIGLFDNGCVINSLATITQDAWG